MKNCIDMTWSFHFLTAQCILITTISKTHFVERTTSLILLDTVTHSILDNFTLAYLPQKKMALALT